MAYCLMSNHIHLLTKPLSEESLFKMMQGLTLCYTQYINRMYGRTGRLWESRYHSCIVDHDKYLWAVARYIEQNPVRAKMVERAEDYSYSSARAHVNGSEDAVLGEDLFHNDRRRDYILLLRTERKVAGHFHIFLQFTFFVMLFSHAKDSKGMDPETILK
jgi:putative transposase